MRKGTEALRHGSLRFVAADRDAIAFVRETAGERVLVHAARSAHEPLRLGTADVGVANGPDLLYGDGGLVHDGGTIELAGDGPSFSVWRI